MGRSGSKAPQTEEQRRSGKTLAEGRRALLSQCSHALLANTPESVPKADGWKNSDILVAV